MKTLSKNTILLVVSALTISYSALAASPDACIGFYDKSYRPLIETAPLAKVAPQRVRTDYWSLPSFFKGKKEVVVPERWEKMIENNTTVAYKYEEKTFERTTITGTKYTVSYHVLEPRDGQYKSTIVLQHGFAESAIYFSSMTRLLVAMGFRVIGMDGANAGHTLLHTVKTRNSYLKAPSPVDDGLALAEVLRLEIRKNEKFILLGHSRGFAVTSLALATGEFDKQLIKHVSSNGYDSWKVDEIVDKQMQIYNPFFFIPGLGPLTEYFAKQIRGIVRKQTNKMSGPILHNTVATHQGIKSKEDVGIELAEEVTRKLLVEATMEIANGLTGKDTSRHGFENAPLYDRRLPLSEHDNGFGLVVSRGNRHTIAPLSEEVKAKTIMIFGDSDKLINKTGSKPIIDQISTTIELTTDRETGTEASHFLPSERPFDLVEILLEIYKEERASSRAKPQAQ